MPTVNAPRPRGLDTPPRRPRPSADELIALNANLEIGRASVCRLAFTRQPWWRDETLGARDIGVDPVALAGARAALADATTIARRERRLAERCGGRILTCLDAVYPQSLHELALPPPVLYVRGSLSKRPGLSIVGARRASAYALDVAATFAADLAARRLAIISGFARGVDLAAHRAAAEAADGVTIAVLGCGLDFDYPRGRRGDRRAIGAAGALITEFPCGAAPLPFNFPIRNRIIAALGLGTLVVEATARSGSLITARLALELGRDIFAVPGRIFDDRAIGPNTLIRDGAFLVQHPRDILETLPLATRSELDGPAEPLEEPLPELPPEQLKVLRALPRDPPIGVDELARRSGLPVEALAVVLLDLELTGWARRHPGAAYARTRRW